MKIVVSYISSLYDYKKTINLIEKTSASGIHVDLMDGLYVGKLNFDDNLFATLRSVKLPLDVHMMVKEPEKYLSKTISLKPACIYVHPKTTKSINEIFEILKDNNIDKGIAINPEDNVEEYIELYKNVDRVLVMSVHPGKGGQKFLEETKKNLKQLKSLQEEYMFKIYVDGGINNETIKYVKDYADGVVSGSYICNSIDFEKQIEKLKLSL